MRLAPDPIEPVRKRRDLPIDVDRAFELYTAKLDTWWPLATHSISGEAGASVRFEGWVGGRVVEIAGDGSESSWADVIAWDPPHRVVLAWHPTPDPVAASIVEVRFEPIDLGARIMIEHRAWEEFGDGGPDLRARYEPGWDAVLEPFVAAVGAP